MSDELKTANRDNKTSNKEMWARHIKQWEESKLSQPAYCIQAGIKYMSFVYWRGLLSAEERKSKEKFVSVQVSAKQTLPSESPKAIQIKLTSGHVIYLPTQLDINLITTIIQRLGGRDA